MKTVRKHVSVFIFLQLALLPWFSFSNYGFNQGVIHDNHYLTEQKPENPVIWVFYKEQPPSLQTQAIIKDFLTDYEDRYVIEYRLITDPDQRQIIESLGLSTEHLPIAIAINGKTGAMIDGEKIIFVNFPDVMHHIGRHPGNWTLEHLQKVLNNNRLLLDKNPEIKNRPGGRKEQ